MKLTSDTLGTSYGEIIPENDCVSSIVSHLTLPQIDPPHSSDNVRNIQPISSTPILQQSLNYGCSSNASVVSYSLNLIDQQYKHLERSSISNMQINSVNSNSSHSLNIDSVNIIDETVQDLEISSSNKSNCVNANNDAFPTNYEGLILKSLEIRLNPNLGSLTRKRLGKNFDKYANLLANSSRAHPKSIFVYKEDESIFREVFIDLIKNIANHRPVSKREILEKEAQSADFALVLDRLHRRFSKLIVQRKIVNSVLTLGHNYIIRNSNVSQNSSIRYDRTSDESLLNLSEGTRRALKHKKRN